MTRIVADASVVVKWLQPLRVEADADSALRLLAAIESGQVDPIEPPHWLAEVAAVITRLDAGTAQQKIAALYAMDIGVVATPGVYLTACKLSVELGHHLFDTLYHAVALETLGATLVTADARYYNKARHYGNISLLADFNV